MGPFIVINVTRNETCPVSQPDLSIQFNYFLMPLTEGAHCTYNSALSGKESRCKARYCRACLKNRYAQALDDIKGDGARTLTKKEKEKHVSGEGYYFQFVH